jgi:hypothetical protein
MQEAAPKEEAKMGWEEALLPYRATDDFQGSALLAQDQNLLRLGAAWPRVPRQLPQPPAPRTEVNLEALWQQTQIDFRAWADLTQLQPLAVMQGFKVLKGLGIILPDGTLSHLAASLLQKEAAGKFLTEFGLKPGDLKR